ncbi:MAG: hypothetical protein ACHQWU_04715 [Gemmatimonadales bacterium]
MQLRFTRYFGGAAAILALGATVALGQARSSRRIPISKEGPAPKVDTVTVYKTDTLQVPGATQYVHDTVRVTGPTQYVHDTVTMLPKPTRARLPYGFYVGVAAGASTPDGNLWIPNSTGWTTQGQIGWQGAKNLLGLRGDVNYGHPGQDSQFASAEGGAALLNFSGDLKLQLPFFHDLFGQARRFALYGIGGYTYAMYKNLPMRLNDLTFVTPTDNSWNSQSGWNAGGGASLMWGRTEIFLESRVIGFNTNSAPMSREIPVVFGINFY